MTTQRTAPGIAGRRGMFAGVAALVAAGLAKLATPERAQAGHNTNIAYDSQTVMHVDVTNTTAGSSRISSNISGTAAFVALNNYPVGISRPDGMLGRTAYTTSNCAGVAGTCEAASGGLGVMGTAKATNGTGVYGFAGSVVPSTVAPAGTGVYGSGPNNGVFGTTANGIGVVGQTGSYIGILGSTSGAGYGVYGDAPSSTAILGSSSSGTGCYGISVSATGVIGSSTSGIGVHGITASGYAGWFDGATVVSGAFTVMGGPKSAAVRHTDGTLRRMYCQESPEPWFEDFGRATLEQGRAEITLAPDFVGVVKGDDYDVFLTPYGDSKGLFVSKKAPGQFSIAEQGGGTSNLAFSYRVVARRRDDVGKRLEKLEFVQPQVKDVKPPVRPTLPDAPAPIAPSGDQQPPRSPGDLTDDSVR